MPRKRTFESWIVVAPVVILLLLFVWGPTLFQAVKLYTAQYTGGVYAFYLDNGNTFFGTINGVGFSTVTLANVYAFQTIKVGEVETSSLVSQQLNSLTTPYNWITLNWNHVLFYERVGQNAKVLKLMHSLQ